ncbi:MAG: hypothetical protein GX595_11870 [Lentisphaerae bacterium]|nr:hypothetical protein [Lentisphaerota bacterium]
MTAEARMSPTWARRMGLVALAFTGFAGWCLYDAIVAYPRFNERATAYNRLLAQEQIDTWDDLARSKGWKAPFDEDDRQPDGRVIVKSRWDIGTQYVMLAVCLALADLAVLRIILANRRTMSAGDDGFRTIEGLLVPYAAITEIDLSRWQRKSIATITFRKGRHALSTRIDDWIYRGGDAVLAEIQRRTGLGGRPVTVAPGAHPAAASTESAAGVTEEGHDTAAAGRP